MSRSRRGFAALAAVLRICTTALTLRFLRWLIETGKDNREVLRLALPILKALPLVSEGPGWTEHLRCTVFQHGLAAARAGEHVDIRIKVQNDAPASEDARSPVAGERTSNVGADATFADLR
jgi:hypothetical protein